MSQGISGSPDSNGSHRVSAKNMKSNRKKILYIAVSLIAVAVIARLIFGLIFPYYEKGDVTLYFRDSVTKNPLENGSVELHASPIGIPYKMKRSRTQWSASSKPLGKDGEMHESSIQLFRYKVTVDAKGYDIQHAIIDLDENSTSEWATLTSSRRFPIAPKKTIEYKFIIK